LKNTLTFLPTICALLLLTGCDRPACNNKNPVFDQYSPDSKEYKDELVKQLGTVDQSKLTFWMDWYEEKNKRVFIHTYVQGDGLCARMVLSVKDSDEGIEGLIKNKGLGYRGAGLEDLKFHIRQDSAQTEFVFNEISGILD
jgi:hypothetical protein